MNIEATCTPHPTETGQYLLYLELAAAEETSQERKPVHLVLSIDASSSMGGPRLACAVEAGRAVAERLGPEDMFCLLAFDRSVRTLFGPGLANDEAKKAIGEALGALRPGVGTALYDALQKSHESLRRVFVRGTRPHVVLLTDGYPSVGPNRPETFAELSRQAAEEGIVTSAVGVGLDFDEAAVAGIAGGGGGRYSFVDKESDIPGALSRHLTDLFSIAIENVTIRLAPGNSVREASLLHRYSTKVGPDGFVVETGPIGRGNPRRLLFVLKASGEPTPVAATIALTVRGSAGNEPETNRILSVPVNPQSPAAKEAVRELHRLTLSSQENDFWEAVHHNDRALAQKAHDAALRTVAALEAAGAPAGQLDADRGRLADHKAVLDGRLSAEAREMARKRSHQTGISRVTSLFEPES
ncbi:MAG: VWA domain-containing protein [Deltaproteobacteria bacterium]|nr:VWA domain-containing protein [Deltaproteobacteria bacterium]